MSQCDYMPRRTRPNAPGIVENIALKYPPASDTPPTEPRKYLLVIVPVSEMPEDADLLFHNKDEGPSYAYVEAPNEHVLARALSIHLDAEVVTEEGVYMADVPALKNRVQRRMVQE